MAVLERSLAKLFDRVAPWGMSVWLTAAAGWYALTVARAVRSPFNDGADSLWVAIWLAFAALILLSRAAFGPMAGILPWGLGLLAVSLAMAGLSRQGGAILLTTWLLTLAWTLGDWLLDRLGATSSDPRLERTCVALALGLCQLALLALLLALTGNLTAFFGFAVLVLLTVILARRFWSAWTALTRTIGKVLRTPLTPDTHSPPEAGLVLTLLGFVALVNLAWALAPEIQYDALNYQLAVPEIYVSEKRLVDLPLFWHSYFAHMFNMLFALVLALHGPTEGKLLVFATGIFAGLGTYALGRSFFGKRVGLWAAAMFYATPLVSWLSSTAYLDLPVALFLITSLLALLRWRTTLQAGWLRASGLLAGAALGTKLTAIYGVLALLATVAVLLVRNGAQSAGRKAGLFGQYLLGLGLFTAPWYLIVFSFTGNPVFPMFNAIFRSPGWPPTNTNFNSSLFGIGVSPGSLLRIPFALTFESNRFGEALPSGGVGLPLALLPVGVALGWRSLAGKKILIAIAVGYLAFWALNAQHARYYVPVLPVVCVLAAATVVSLSGRRDLRRLNIALLGLVVVAQVSLLFVQYWNVPERVPIRLAFGAESREAFLARALPAYEAVRHLNRVVRPGEKAISAGADSMRFYAKPPLASMEETVELQRLSFPPGPAQLAQNLMENRYAYLLVNGVAPVEGETRPYLTSEFLTRYATLEYSRGPVKLYRLRQPGRAPRSAENNLVGNPGFEILDSSGRPASWIPYGRPALIRDPSQTHDGGVAVISDSKNGLSQPVRVRPGARYLLRHWTRTAEPGSFARLQVNWLDGWGQMVDVSIEVVPTLPQWASHEMLVTAPPRATAAVVYASVHENGRVLFDDFFFGQGRPSPADRSRN